MMKPMNTPAENKEMISRSLRTAVLKELAASGALAFAKPGEPGFKLKSGRMSDYYVNLRAALLSSKTLTHFGHLLVGKLNKEFPGELAKGTLVLTGTGVAGRTLVGAILGMCGMVGMAVRGLYIRDEVKDHGIAKMWEGPTLKPDDKIIILDDVLTTGGTAIELKSFLIRTFNLEPKALVVCCDREEGGREALEEHNIKVFSVFVPSDLKKYKEAMDEAERAKSATTEATDVAGKTAATEAVQAVPPGVDKAASGNL